MGKFYQPYGRKYRYLIFQKCPINIIMGWLRSLTPSFRANRQEAQALAENVFFKEVVIPALRGTERILSMKFPINDIEWFHAHFEDKQNGFTVAGFIALQEAFKVKQTVEGEINFSYMKYKDKCSPHIRQRVTKPHVRVDGKGIYFDFFINFSN